MSSNNRIDGNLPSQGEPPSTFKPKKDDTTYISPTGERFPELAKERSISTHIQATEVKNRNDFKGFMLAKNKLYADIATNSITSQKTRKNKLKISVALYDAFIAPFKSMKTILSVIITGTPPEKVDNKLTEEQKDIFKNYNVSIRIFLAVLLPLMLPFIIVGSILEISVLPVSLPIQKLNEIIQDNKHAKNLMNYLYSTVLEETFNMLDIDDTKTDAKFWQDLAKTFDEGINNAKKSIVIPKADKEDKSLASDTKSSDYTTQIKKLLASDFNNIIKNLPDDKVSSSFKDNFKKEIFADNNDLKPEIIDLIEDITKNKLKEYVDGLKDI